MDIGAALAAARSQAGLTVDQVSERTRIRAVIIRAIEQDDFSPCGGDFYARGHIRAIARVVDADPVPLIEEYDQAHPPAGPQPRTGGSGRGAGPRPGSRGGGPGGVTAAEAFRPPMPLQGEGARRLPVRAGMLGLLVLAVVAVIAVPAYLLATPGSAHSPSQATLSRTHRPATPTPVATSASASPAPAPTPLPVASAEAFGPAGPSQGDNPQGALFATDANAGTAWHTDWYATANFNGNQPGTGLLLDMGSTVTVSSVQVMLGPAAGGSVQLRAGSSPSLAALSVVAQATLPGGALTLQGSSPVSARYLLIWFTRLPPDNVGTYQAFVYNVTVSGTA